MSNTPDCGPTAGASGEPDPNFAAIERHRAAFRIWQDAYDRLGELQDRLVIFSEIPPDYTGAPEWIEANKSHLAAVEEVASALEVLFSTPPTTIAGVADLLDYVSREECHPVAGTYEPILERTFLSQKAGANFLPMIAATLPRRANGEPDPIFAAIERDRAALRGWLAAIDRQRALRQIIPEARRLWESDEKPDRCIDAPEWIEAHTALIEAHEELDKALEAVLSGPPTTIAGVADLLDYVGREESLETAFDGGYVYQGSSPAWIVEGVRKAAANFLPMIAATLRSITADSTSR